MKSTLRKGGTAVFGKGAPIIFSDIERFLNREESTERNWEKGDLEEYELRRKEKANTKKEELSSHSTLTTPFFFVFVHLISATPMDYFCITLLFKFSTMN